MVGVVAPIPGPRSATMRHDLKGKQGGGGWRRGWSGRGRGSQGESWGELGRGDEQATCVNGFALFGAIGASAGPTPPTRP